MTVQIFGRAELLDHLAAGGEVGSHLISIGDPPSLLPPRASASPALPAKALRRFDAVLRLGFYEANERRHVVRALPRRVFDRRDAQRVIDFYVATKGVASGYTIQSGRGLGRAPAVAIALLYMMRGNEAQVLEELRRIRPKALPMKRITRMFDSVYGTDLTGTVQRHLYGDYVERMREEFETLARDLKITVTLKKDDSGLEDLEAVVPGPS